MVDLVGEKFGRLTVTKMFPPKIIISKNNKRRYEYPILCDCDCGNKDVLITDKNRLIHGHTKSCGCIPNELRIKQGHKNFKGNEYTIKDNYCIGITSNTNKEFLFDLEDFETIKNYTWFETEYGYLCTLKSKRFHRIILDIDDDMQVDHINNNKLDNRKCNLRIVSRSKNCMNKQIRPDNRLGITGVYKTDNKYRSYICKERKLIYLGAFDNLDDAIKARKEAEEKYFGEFSYDNSQKYSKSYSEIGKEPSYE